LQIWKFQQTTEEQITRSLEAYLMWLFGKIMFIESHGDTISAVLSLLHLRLLMQ
jgi:hypothetical protein